MLEVIVNYFEHIPHFHRVLILASGITFLWIVEGIIPLFSFKNNKWKHAYTNIFFIFTSIMVNFAFALFIVKVSDWSVKNHFGLLQQIEMPLWIFLITGLLLLDLISAYLVHFVEHKIRWMWRFHMVHHADTHVDITTANRHHPGESIFRAAFTLLGVAICGAPIWLVVLYQNLSALISQFNHANIRLPGSIDKVLSWVIVSPNMHKVHHHFERPQTDSNFGNIFSVWDRIFGTYNYTPISEIKYGLDILDGSKDENLKYQLTFPFDKNLKTTT